MRSRKRSSKFSPRKTPLTKPRDLKRVSSSRPKAALYAAAEVERPPHLFRTAASPGAESTPTEFHRTRPTASDPTASLTPDQLLLDAQLRAWRKAESERIGLPQFFVLGSSTLRSIVLLRPRTLAQLQTISGIGPEKAAKFGATIVGICSA
jgi:ATP-dependent DNA helicase RecQ